MIDALSRSQARTTMEREVRHRLPRWDLGLVSDEMLFELWGLVVAERELWYHAEPHHHREIALIRHNGSIELFGNNTSTTI